MISKNQFESVKQLLSSGVNNYVFIRQQAGLTSDELDDILENLDYYTKKFADEDRQAEIAKLKNEKKKPWWKR